jgi:polyisoprenoid-binding protein YceI
MVTWVRGHIKDVHGWIEFDDEDPGASRAYAELDAAGLWTGEPDRDAHLKTADFLDVEHHPKITFTSTRVEVLSAHELKVWGDFTLRGVTREVCLDTCYLGQWTTPYWEGGVDRGPMLRAGFAARTVISRHDFGVSWNSQLDRGGVVVGERVYIEIDAEALRKA